MKLALVTGYGCLIAAGVSGQTGLPERLQDAVAVWDFSAGAGDTLRDVSGNGHDGAIVGATWVREPSGHALRFEGKGHYVRVPDAPGLRLQPPYTLGVWFRTTRSDNNGVFLVKGCALWAYSDWQNPAGKLDWDYIGENLENMDIPFSFVFPAPEGPMPSVGWEGVREGVDDHKYMSTLAGLIEKAEAGGHAEAAQRAAGRLQEITDTVRVEGYREGAEAGRATGWRLGGHYHRSSPQPEIGKEDYDRFRHLIAREILRLQEVLP